MKFFLVLFIGAIADEMLWIDYNSDSEFKWDSLQASKDYTVESGTHQVKFNIGKNIENSCGGQSASVISFSNAGESCEILGRHELVYFSTFTAIDLTGISIFYEGGALCRDSTWGDLKRRVQFKLICSSTETDFYLSNSLNDCTTIFEKFTKTGCAQEITYSTWVKITFIM